MVLVVICDVVVLLQFYGFCTISRYLYVLWLNFIIYLLIKKIDSTFGKDSP
jgi:hypothetical protein